MHFLINGNSSRGKSRRRTRARTTVKRRRRRSTSLSGVATMAKRRRRRKAATRATAPRRRRRRVARKNPGGLAASRRVRRVRSNPAKRRRHARRKFRRNPGVSLGSARGIVGGIVQGLKDGGAVLVGQVATRKAGGAIRGMLPATAQATVAASAPARIALSLISAVAVSLVAKKALPGQARLISAGAFAQTLTDALNTQPTIAAYLSAYPVRRIPANASALQRANARSPLGAWTGAAALQSGGNGARAGLGAYANPRQQGGAPIGVGIL